MWNQHRIWILNYTLFFQVLFSKIRKGWKWCYPKKKEIDVSTVKKRQNSGRGAKNDKVIEFCRRWIGLPTLTYCQHRRSSLPFTYRRFFARHNQSTHTHIHTQSQLVLTWDKQFGGKFPLKKSNIWLPRGRFLRWRKTAYHCITEGNKASSKTMEKATNVKNAVGEHFCRHCTGKLFNIGQEGLARSGTETVQFK